MSILFTFNGITVVSTPAYPAAKSLDFTLTDYVAAASNAFSGQQQVNDWQASLLAMSVQLPPMRREYGADWSAFLMQCRGMANAFLMGDPTGATPQGSNLTTGSQPLVNGANQVGYNLITKGWVPSAEKVLKRGDWIQVIYRLHKVLDDVDADSGGNAVLAIYPPLRDSLADGTPIITTNTQGLFRLASNTRKFSIGAAEIYGFQFDVREAI